MFTRVRIAIGVGLIALLMTSIHVFAKGGFDFITITGPDLEEVVRLSDTSLTEDFFTFAHFYEDKTRAPTDPGKGYEITRHYVQGASDVIFDRLHYYPETGFIFYDGIENGASEYDDEWYSANPEIKTVFEAALARQTGSTAPVDEKQPITSPSQPEEVITQAKSAESSFPALLSLATILTTGLAALFAFAFWRRKSSVQ